MGRQVYSRLGKGDVKRVADIARIRTPVATAS